MGFARRSLTLQSWRVASRFSANNSGRPTQKIAAKSILQTRDPVFLLRPAPRIEARRATKQIPIIRPMKLTLKSVILALSVFISCSETHGAVSEAEILQQIGSLRGIQPTKNKKKLAELNARMDTAWHFLEAHKIESAPLVARELAKALDETTVDQFLALDLGNLILSLQGKEGEGLAVKALGKIDPKAAIIQWNFKELFDFAHKLAELGSPEVLAQIDRIFLPGTDKLEFFHAPHLVRLSPTDLCVLLYGVTGAKVEAHLLQRLADSPAARQRVLEVLCQLGSEKSVGGVKQAMLSAGDYETFSRGLKFMMTLGGPAGKEAVLGFDPKPLDAKARAYHSRILPEVKKVSPKALKDALRQLDTVGSGKAPDDQELKARLKKMYDNYGVDTETTPSAITASKLPREFLLEQLKQIRSRMCHRKDNHALEDLDVTNLIINTLQFMP